MNPEKPSEEETRAMGLPHNSALDDLFDRIKQELDLPAPATEAVPAAVQAISNLSLRSDVENAVRSEAEPPAATQICAACGSQNPRKNKFCAICGVPLEIAPVASSAAPAMRTAEARNTPPVNLPAGQHHYHHHYHHHYFSTGEGGSPAAANDMRGSGPASASRDLTKMRSPAGAALSRAEVAVRKMTHDWALACNNKQLDDLVELYSADGLLLRSNVLPVRGAAGIREFFVSALDSGLGEVEFEALRVEVMGDSGYEAGRCKMLVPVAMGKRREERGKYLMIFARQSSGEWRIVADCWSSDLGLAAASEPAAAKTGAANGPNQPGRLRNL